jgi:hypothetical protein
MEEMNLKIIYSKLVKSADLYIKILEKLSLCNSSLVEPLTPYLENTLKKISVMHVIKLGFAPVSFPPG